MKLVAESLEELHELVLPGKKSGDILSDRKFKELSPEIAFIDSIDNNFIEGIKTTLEKIDDINDIAIYPLPRAVGHGNIDIVRLILDKGANVQADGNQPLATAIRHNHEDIGKLLIKRGADVQDTIEKLYNTSNRLDQELIDRILRWEAEVDINEGLKLPGKNPDDLFKSKELINATPNEMLRTSVDNNFTPGVKKALDDGADLHITYKELLGLTVWEGNIEIVQMLLDDGADLFYMDCQVLTIAVETGNYEMVKLLLDNGATLAPDSEIMIDGLKAKGSDDIAELLVKHMEELYG